nr:immunoglobulin light chain junction region [Macaca mulatta]MOW27361.1 immunoglobulin light chain junction region [Macaca mulatta]MOW27532.1 immunoglobulin light chain junction region [Macaca mulatta]MOW27853.1 immunoglobulin light chain junction region [Macaca mulatta]MOW28060.1 immunoglobulin light chain junction region [Macaca mulatta]
DYYCCSYTTNNNWVF